MSAAEKPPVDVRGEDPNSHATKNVAFNPADIATLNDQQIMELINQNPTALSAVARMEVMGSKRQFGEELQEVLSAHRIAESKKSAEEARIKGARTKLKTIGQWPIEGEKLTFKEIKDLQERSGWRNTTPTDTHHEGTRFSYFMTADGIPCMFAAVDNAHLVFEKLEPDDIERLKNPAIREISRIGQRLLETLN